MTPAPSNDPAAAPPVPTEVDDGFRRTADVLDRVEGWMTPDQARWLWDRAKRVPAEGRIVEIGSYHGRSTILFARGAPSSVEVVAIDPHGGNDRGPQEIEGYAAEAQEDHERFVANLEAAGVRRRVRHVRRPSQEAHDEVSDPIDLLYIDGAHRFSPARADIVSWAPRVREGGEVAIHDAFSSIGVTSALLTSLVFSGGFRYEGRTTSLVVYRRERVRGWRRVVNAVRQLAQLPAFARNVALKALILARLRPLVRLLRHDPAVWPH